MRPPLLEINPDPGRDDDFDGTEDVSEVVMVTHGEAFVERPYLASRLGVIAALGAGTALLASGEGLVACLVATVVGGIVGGIAGFVIVLVAMSFSAEQAGYGRVMGLSQDDEPSLGYRVVDRLYLPLPPFLGAAATFVVSALLP